MLAVMLEETVIFSALIVTSAAVIAPTISTSSFPSSPLMIRSTPGASNEWMVSTSLLRNGIPRSPPRLIVRLLVGLVNVMDSKVGISEIDARVSVVPSSVNSARSSRWLVEMTRSATSVLSMIGSNPAYVITSPSRPIVPESGPVAV